MVTQTHTNPLLFAKKKTPLGLFTNGIGRILAKQWFGDRLLNVEKVDGPNGE